jgi:striatin 1/3/4
MDIVRGVQFVPEIETLVSVSEDCTVKLWSLKGLEQSGEDSIEPYITLRGHTGPLFTVAGPHPQHKRIIFTAGSEGVIRMWNLPSISEVN